MCNLPAVKRQHLLAEFAGLKQACPHGIYVSLTPGDPALWSGIIFVRKGPYASAILRFNISFPDTYPTLPPLVTFSTDMFHPLITPLTTYMYSTDVQDGGTASANDEERLPPGGFSLRHGFAGWFGRRSRAWEQRSAATRGGNRGGHGGGSGGSVGEVTTPTRAVATATGTAPGSAALAASSSASVPGYARTGAREVSTYEVLRYIRSTFDDEDVLDSVPLEAAGNPGAWHAWRTHRRQIAGKPFPSGGSDAAAEGKTRPEADAAAGVTTRRPEEWNWEGVWEERVKRGIAASQSEGVLFGNFGTADDVINFLSMQDAEVEGVKSRLLQTLGAAALYPFEYRLLHLRTDSFGSTECLISTPLTLSRTGFMNSFKNPFLAGYGASRTVAACAQSDNGDVPRPLHVTKRSALEGGDRIARHARGCSPASDQSDATMDSPPGPPGGCRPLTLPKRRGGRGGRIPYGSPPHRKSNPCVLAPSIVVTPEYRVVDEGVATVWAAVELSTQVCLVDSDGWTLHPGTRLLFVTHIRLQPAARRLGHSHVRQNSDKLIEDLEHQLGGTVTEYVQVRLTYRHSGFPQSHLQTPVAAQTTAPDGLSSFHTVLQTTAVATIKRRNAASPWSPPPIIQRPNPLFQVIASHWGSENAHAVMQRAIRSQSVASETDAAPSSLSLIRHPPVLDFLSFLAGSKQQAKDDDVLAREAHMRPLETGQEYKSKTPSPHARPAPSIPRRQASLRCVAAPLAAGQRQSEENDALSTLQGTTVRRKRYRSIRRAASFFQQASSSPSGPPPSSSSSSSPPLPTLKPMRRGSSKDRPGADAQSCCPSLAAAGAETEKQRGELAAGVAGQTGGGSVKARRGKGKKEGGWWAGWWQ
ncbi:hypothetical protein N657DRAFT_567360 [Parathielavia appendiculata]|uniref:UBC core domain-containing protein n=1 Tax=Parathielavia appendiculata TaxID=2587402 RepID=A0AAN6Z590_9PEZI|nr:hypothetical protein N657DRAFT_567360 [Parathielavia appendiculata]